MGAAAGEGEGSGGRWWRETGAQGAGGGDEWRWVNEVTRLSGGLVGPFRPAIRGGVVAGGNYVRCGW
jgi:hypothetical protein